jgi:hypothetical protein
MFDILLPLASLLLAAPSDDLRCEIAMRPSGALTEISATAFGPPGTQGTYRMSVRRVGNGNSALSSQGGAFRIDASGEAALARTITGGSGRPEATLRLQVGDRLVDCSAEG